MFAMYNNLFVSGFGTARQLLEVTSSMSARVTVMLTALTLAACGGGGGGAATSNTVPNNVNNAPTISGTPPASVTAGQTYSFTPSASDADGDALTFTLANAPTWLNSFNSSTGAVSGTPQSGDVGLHTGLIISVSDGQSSSALPQFSIQVTGNQSSNNAPTISGNPPTSIAAGSSYSFTPNASDADGDSLFFTAQNLPSWANFDEFTGRISGTPQAGDAGTTNNIVISVTDGTDTASLGAFSITVTSGSGGNNAPSISGSPATSVQVGNNYAFTPSASDPDGDTLTFSISGIPNWASFNTSTGALTGSPQSGDAGNYPNIVISVSDGNLSASLAPFSIDVNSVSLGSATLSWTPPTQNEDGTDLNDLTGYKFYYGTSSGSYPNQVTVNQSGIVSYVIDNLAPGTYYFVATVVNSAGVESQFSNEATKTIL